MTHWVEGPDGTRHPAVMLRPWVVDDLRKMLADAPAGEAFYKHSVEERNVLEWQWIGKSIAWFQMLTEGRLDLYEVPEPRKEENDEPQ